MNLIPIQTLPDAAIRALGYDWTLHHHTSSYLTDRLVEVTPEEADAYYWAVERVQSCANLVIEAHLGIDTLAGDPFLDELAIPRNLQKAVIHSWHSERHVWLYGRYDVAGGLDGLPVYALEFNADTATLLPETAVVQWAQLKTNGLAEESQWNTLFAALVERFRVLLAKNPDRPAKMVFTCFSGFPEDHSNTEFLMEAALEAGFHTDFAYIEDVEFVYDGGETDGIYLSQNGGEPEWYPFMFKLIPWEDIATDEPELADILSRLILEDMAIVVNPPYSLIYQSKALFAYISQARCAPESMPYTRQHPLPDGPYARKPLFGREGGNVTLHPEGQPVIAGPDGPFEDWGFVYQRLVEMPKDELGNHYQAGIFYVNEPVALGFRRGGPILSNTAQFVGHIIKKTS